MTLRHADCLDGKVRTVGRYLSSTLAWRVTNGCAYVGPLDPLLLSQWSAAKFEKLLRTVLSKFSRYKSFP